MPSNLFFKKNLKHRFIETMLFFILGNHLKKIHE